eukprot:990744-Rhodomonas_salina.1
MTQASLQFTWPVSTRGTQVPRRSVVSSIRRSIHLGYPPCDKGLFLCVTARLECVSCVIVSCRVIFRIVSPFSCQDACSSKEFLVAVRMTKRNRSLLRAFRERKRSERNPSPVSL